MESMKQPEEYARMAEASLNAAAGEERYGLAADYFLGHAKVYATLAVAAAIRKPLFKSEEPECQK